MSVVCSTCGRPNAEDARFCSACGRALETQPVREERKVVTVLFADLVGFTSRAETLDPEDVRELLSPYYARLRSELERSSVSPASARAASCASSMSGSMPMPS